MKEKSTTWSNIKKARGPLITIALMICVYLFFNLCSGGSFLTKENLSAIVSHSVVPTFTAFAILFIFTSGMTDLSLGANVLLASNLGALLAKEVGLGYFGLIFGAVAASVAMCLLSTLVCSCLRIPSWISSIGMALIYEGVLLGITSIRYNRNLGVMLPSLGHDFREIGAMPWIAVLWIVGVIAAYIVFNHTKIGIGIRAYGSNISVAKSMGFERAWVLFMGSLVSGIFVGCGSAINMSFSGTVSVVSGLQSFSQLFKPLASYFLALAFQKQFNLPIGVMLSAFFVMSFFNFLTHMSVPTGTWQEVLLGSTVILFGILSQRGNKEIVK